MRKNNKYKPSEQKLAWAFSKRCYEARREKNKELPHGECKIIIGNAIDERERAKARQEFYMTDIKRNKIEQKKIRGLL